MGNLTPMTKSFRRELLLARQALDRASVELGRIGQVATNKQRNVQEAREMAYAIHCLHYFDFDQAAIARICGMDRTTVSYYLNRFEG